MTLLTATSAFGSDRVLLNGITCTVSETLIRQKNKKYVESKKLNSNKTKMVKRRTLTLTDRRQVVLDHTACVLEFLIQRPMMLVHGNQPANVSCTNTNVHPSVFSALPPLC